MLDADPYIREAQYRTFLGLRTAGDRNVGFVSSFDLSKSWYHPQIRGQLDARAATRTLATRYKVFQGRDADNLWLPPLVEHVEITTRDDGEDRMVGCAIAGEDRRFHPADCKWLSLGANGGANREANNRKVIVLKFRHVPAPAHYRYAWARNPMGDVVSVRGVSLASQRSDD